jgi:hypothetical protein
MRAEEEVGSPACSGKGLHADGRVELSGSADRGKVVGGLVLERQTTRRGDRKVGVAGARLSR